MRLRNEKVETGHLLSFVSKKDHSTSFFLFFPVEGLEQFDTLFEVTKGFEKCLGTRRGAYDYRGYSVSNYGDIEKIFPEIDSDRIFIFEQGEFLSESGQFIEPFANALLKRFDQGQKQIFPNIVTGAMAVGSAFYDRETSVREIWGSLQNKKNILLRAPRRFGKTSLLKQIATHPEKGWQICLADLEGGDSAESLVETILTAMLENESFDSYLPAHLAGLHAYAKTDSEKLRILREERQTIKKDWKKYAEMLFHQMEKSGKDTRFLFILDEVSFLIEDMMGPKDDAEDAIKELMRWFQEARKQYNNIQFVLSGSEHLPSFLNAFEIDSHLDDLVEAHLDLFDQDIAREFIFLVLAGQNITAAIDEIDLMLTLMGKPIPYFLHLFLDAICRTCKEKKSISTAEIESVYYHHLLGSESKRYFESITRQLDRYQRYGGRNTAGAKSILDRLAIADTPVAPEELKIIWEETTGSPEKFNIMLDIMRDDFYLVKDENQQVFIDIKLIKEWWRKYGIAGSR